MFRRWRPHVVCIQETKIGVIDRRVVNSIGGERWFDWVYLEAVGSAGGILGMWDRRVITRMDSEMGSFSVSCLFKAVENDRL